jgi:hypothetical protein
MRRLGFTGWLFLGFVLLSPRLAVACPACAEAVPATSGAEVEDQVRLARGYNHSIYLMAGMPYFLLGTVGYLVYRRLRNVDSATPLGQNQAQSASPRVDRPAAPPGEVGPCSLPSPDVDS